MFAQKKYFRHFLEVLDTTKSDREAITLRILKSVVESKTKKIFTTILDRFLEVLDTTKSDRKAITLRCPREGSRGRKPPQGLGQSPSWVLGGKPLAQGWA